MTRSSGIATDRGPVIEETASAVVATNLSKSYGEVVALESVSFNVTPGEIFGFIGPDGAGKTTLFRILTTLLVPNSGNAKVLGLDVVTELWQLRSKIGYMPGRFSLYPDLSVEENLNFFASVFGTNVAAQQGLIAPIYGQIEPFNKRRAGDLSGGMKQKLALSCALVHRPDILFLDEPTTGVDAVSRREFWDLLEELRAGGLTIVVSTPYMEEAARCARVALIQKGRILEIDAPDRIGINYPYPIFAVKSSGRIPLLQALRRFPHAYSVFPFGSELHYTDNRKGNANGSLVPELAQYLNREGFPNLEIEPIRAGIEDSFMLLMGSTGSTEKL